MQLDSSSHKNAKAEGYARMLQDGHIIAYLLMLKVGNYSACNSLMLQTVADRGS